jgi:hypothetical protein
LAFEVESELRNLEKVVEELPEFLQHAPAEPHKVQIQGTAKYLHDFYNTGIKPGTTTTPAGAKTRAYLFPVYRFVVTALA